MELYLNLLPHGRFRPGTQSSHHAPKGNASIKHTAENKQNLDHVDLKLLY